jgi:hypothetical protein
MNDCQSDKGYTMCRVVVRSKGGLQEAWKAGLVRDRMQMAMNEKGDVLNPAD